MMSFPLALLPAEVVSVHIVPLLAIKDLVRIDCAIVTCSMSFWQDVVRQTHVRFSDLSTVREAEWLLNGGYKLEEINLLESNQSLKVLMMNHAHQIRKVHLALPDPGFEDSPQIIGLCSRVTIQARLSLPELQSLTQHAANITDLTVLTDDNSLADFMTAAGTRLTKLSIRYGMFSEKLLSLIEAVGPQLLDLHLEVPGLAPEIMCGLVAKFPNLQKLWASNGRRRVGDEGVNADSWLYAVSQHCIKLRDLRVMEWTFTLPALRAVLRGCRQLRDFAHNASTIRAPDLLQAYAECDAQLEDVEIRCALRGDVTHYQELFGRVRTCSFGESFLQSTDACTAAGYMRSLESVYLESAEVAATKRVLRALLRHAPRLHSLFMSAALLKHPEISVVAAELLTHRAMQRVTLYGGESFRVLQLPVGLSDALASAEHGRLLSLRVCGFSVTDQQLLPIIRSNPRLETLQLPKATTLTDATVSAIAEHCRNLKDLNVHQAHKLTEAALVRLFQRCHRLTTMYVSDRAMSLATAAALCAEDRIWPVCVKPVNVYVPAWM